MHEASLVVSEVVRGPLCPVLKEATDLFNRLVGREPYEAL
jgi:hypothetical protein